MKTHIKQKSLLIKKYENRRLYDTTNSRYVNLDEVARMMQNGDNVRVVDAATGEDITRLLLTQIIVDDAKTSDSNFPLDILRQMVLASGRASQESAIQYLNALLDISQNSYKAMTPPLNTLEFVPRKDETRSTDPESRPAAPARGGGAPSVKSPAVGEVNELKQRLAELETLVSKLAPKKAPRKKS